MRNEAKTKDIKVRITQTQSRVLAGLLATTGKNNSEVLREALDHYAGRLPDATRREREGALERAREMNALYHVLTAARLAAEVVGAPTLALSALADAIRTVAAEEQVWRGMLPHFDKRLSKLERKP